MSKEDYNASKGFNRKVGQKGAQISGGQKQRIAIARAIIREPKVLLLDEATSALDTTTEKAVQDELNKLMSGKTSVIVAYRLSIIQEADCIYVVDNGIIVESGKHDDLMSPRGVYYKLVVGTA